MTSEQRERLDYLHVRRGLAERGIVPELDVDLLRELAELEAAERAQTRVRASRRTMVSAGEILVGLAMAILMGCVIAPDGRRVLSPGARAVGEALLEQVLTCSTRVGLAAAAEGGPPSDQVLLDASACHVGLAAEEARRALEVAPAPSIQHGRLIWRAQQLETEGQHAEALDVARECDREARGLR